MSTIKKTTHDGWDCAPSIVAVAETMSEANSFCYEIKNCVRGMSVRDMLSDMNDFLSDLKDAIEEAENQLDGVEFETVSDEE